jgi:hypothetical protein
MSTVMVGDLLSGLERDATNRVRVTAGGQTYRLRFTAVVVYRSVVMDINRVPIGETCRVIGDEGSDYTATIVA